jgi:ankyrin repeat protein
LLAALSETTGAAPLVDAASDKQRATALALLAEGVDANVRSPDNTTALHWAAYHDDVELAQRLLAAGADANAVNDYGAFPLAEAAAVGNAAMISLLLDAGAKVETANADGQTALMIVARTNKVDAARRLIEAGADVNRAEQWRGQTPLMWAAAQGQPGMIRLMLEHGAEPDVRSAINDWVQVSSESRRMFRPDGGLTPLLFAAREGCEECARALVEGGADPDFTDPKNVTPLFLAIDNTHFDTAKYLIEAGANVNKWDWYGRTPLYAAVDQSTVPAGGRADRATVDDTSALELVDLLLERGANPDIALKLPPPYRSIPDDRGCDSMLTTGMTPLLRAAKVFDVPAMQRLLAHEADFTIPNQDGVLPIHAAAGLGSSACDPRGYGGGIPHYETADVQQASIAALETLLAAGADVNAQGPEVSGAGSRFGGKRTGQTALHGAAGWGWDDVVRFLVAKGARVDLRDAQGRTAYDAAAGGGGGRGAAAGGRQGTAALLAELCAEQAGCDATALTAPRGRGGAGGRRGGGPPTR